MSMTILRSCITVVFGILVAASTVQRAAASAPWEPSSDSFGDGMHAYFGGSNAEAESCFHQAVGDNPNDPRVHYFLGLCLLRQGYGDEARTEMTIGAALEARAPGSYAVGKSLERVQGGDRLLLEEYRRQARVNRTIERSELKRTSVSSDYYYSRR